MPSQSRRLERKKLLADPFTILVIILLVVLLTLFILYPLTMLMSDSVYSASSFNVYTVEQSADAVKELFSQTSPRVREIGVSAADARPAHARCRAPTTRSRRTAAACRA